MRVEKCNRHADEYMLQLGDVLDMLGRPFLFFHMDYFQDRIFTLIIVQGMWLIDFTCLSPLFK
jgi:hypothetical protein